jgi:hypothetical protein
MEKKKIRPYEVLAVAIVILLFLSLSLIVLFKREWLDSIFYRSDSQEEITMSELSPGESLDYEEKEYPQVNIEISRDANGNGQLFLNLNTESNITGVELELRKDESLEITDFTCIEPFECIFFDFTENELNIVAIVPVSIVDPFKPGRILVGEFTYTGSGRLYLDSQSESFVSDSEYPEFNILDSNDREFLF